MVLDVRLLGKSYHPMVQLTYGREDDHDQAGVDIEQQLHEELSVVEADAIIDPWAVVVHI